MTTVIVRLAKSLRSYEREIEGEILIKKHLMIRKVRYAISRWYIQLRFLVELLGLEHEIPKWPEFHGRGQLKMFRLIDAMPCIDEAFIKGLTTPSEDVVMLPKPFFGQFLKNMKFSWKALRAL